MSTLEMYERNLSVNNKRVKSVALTLARPGTTPHEEDDLLTEMEEAIRLVKQARRDLSVAKDLRTDPQPKSNMDKALSACRTMKSLTPPEEQEEEPPALEEDCAACGTDLHHTLGEFGVDGDDVEIPTWRRVYDPVCDEMEVDSGSMVCRECLENGSDFEHSVDCYSDGEEAAD